MSFTNSLRPTSVQFEGTPGGRTVSLDAVFVAGRLAVVLSSPPPPPDPRATARMAHAGGAPTHSARPPRPPRPAGSPDRSHVPRRLVPCREQGLHDVQQAADVGTPAHVVELQ